MNAHLLVFSASIAAVVTGCASNRPATSAAVELLPEIDIIELRDDATKALDENRALKVQLDSLRMRIAALEQRAVAAVRVAPPEMPARTPPPQPVPAAVSAPTGSSPPTVTTPPPPVQATRPIPAPPTGAPSAGVEGGWYQEGLDAFNARDYVRAEERFLQVVRSDSLDAYAPNARYWIGECRYARGDFAGAVAYFQEVLAGAQSSKHDDAQLKVGMCYLKLARTGDARTVFEEFLRRFPQSEYADRVRGYLERLRSE